MHRCTRASVYVDTLGRRLSTVSATAGLSFCPRSSVNTMINMRHLAFHQTQRLSLFQNQLPLGSRRARNTGILRPTGIHRPTRNKFHFVFIKRAACSARSEFLLIVLESMVHGLRKVIGFVSNQMARIWCLICAESVGSRRGYGWYNFIIWSLYYFEKKICIYKIFISQIC